MVISVAKAKDGRDMPLGDAENATWRSVPQDWADRGVTEAAADVLYALWSAHECEEISLASGESARWM